jgi:hypothetical protein
VSAHDPNAFSKVTFEELGAGTLKAPEYDVFVFTPASKEYLQYASKGEPLSEEKLKTLGLLSQQSMLFLRRVDADELRSPKKILDSFDASKAFKDDVLGAEASQTLRDSFRRLSNDTDFSRRAGEIVTQMSESLVKIVAPDLDNVRLSLLKSLKNLHLMNHTAAISSIAILVSVANDLKTKATLQTLTLTCLLMDSSMSELEDFELEQYYKDRHNLPAHVWEKIKSHPVKSQQIAMKLPATNELVNQIILSHHELHNGMGYHRGIRINHSLTEVVSLAVDWYEQVKMAELNKKPRGLGAVLVDLLEPKVEVHMRRHTTKTVKAVVEFLGLKV